MARLPRIIVSGVPHHVTQRGNRRQRVFIEDDDYSLYKEWLAQSCRTNGVEVWSYCLMPNHVHLILVPSDETGLSRAVGATHRKMQWVHQCKTAGYGSSVSGAVWLRGNG
jgi:putative transposase